ncbi:hypothetical protein OESDEN_06427 [Oesophagostomum dentatum]|uniref:Uncharacterized protein n=1 Tax=Oesophagostomum dentatum TaxID=61180 RepID=A0A0B1T810_OESDE|nr:hypothetical protein OESDEN_06427 [Oesophagostomum dentatum]
MGCYARVWNYEYRILNSSHYMNECPQKDKFFRRHCVVAKTLPLFDYILFLDADIGVVNPKRLIEEYIDANAEIVFYDRFYNWEIMAGAYLVKNTRWAQQFLYGFANYEFRLPKSFHGTDNGALHAYIAEVILSPNDSGLAECLFVYNQSRGYEDLFMYEACIRDLLGNGTNFGLIKILKKGTGWARDNWMTNSLWSPERDFMMHNWKLNQLKSYRRTPVSFVGDSDAKWYNPLAGPISLSFCICGNVSWAYDENLIRTREDVDKRLQEYAAEVEIRRAASLQRLRTFLSKDKRKA